MVASVEIVKLVAAILAVMARPAAAVASVLLQVTPNFVPSDSSGKTRIWLFADTAVVYTTTVVAPVAIPTLPAVADPQTAGDAELEQLLAVRIAVA